MGDQVVAPPASHDPKRNQWVAENLLDALPGCDARDPSCDAVTIGVTDLDIYMSEYAAQFAWIYTTRNDARHVEVVSTFRMASFDAHAERAAKIIARDIALDYCGLPISNDPHSILSPTLGGQSDLDNMDESIWR